MSIQENLTLSNTISIDKGQISTRYSKRHLNKKKLPNCSINSTKLPFLLYCWKCASGRREVCNRRSRKFTTIRQLFFHIVVCHSGIDRNEYPSRDACVKQLQVLADMIFLGVLK